MRWSSPKTFIKNVIADSYDNEFLEKVASAYTEQPMKVVILSVEEELWHEGYIELDRSKWSAKDYESIRAAAEARLNEVNEEE